MLVGNGVFVVNIKFIVSILIHLLSKCSVPNQPLPQASIVKFNYLKLPTLQVIHQCIF